MNKIITVLLLILCVSVSYAGREFGDNSVVTIVSGDSNQPDGDFTYCFWVMFSTFILNANGEIGIFSQGDTAGGLTGPSLMLDLGDPPGSKNYLRYLYTTDGAGGWDADINTGQHSLPNLLQWYHYSVVQKGIRVDFYVDCVSKANDTNTGGGIDWSQSSWVDRKFTIGSRAAGGGAFNSFANNATFDDVRFYEYALTVEELERICNNSAEIIKRNGVAISVGIKLEGDASGVFTTGTSTTTGHSVTGTNNVPDKPIRRIK